MTSQGSPPPSGYGQKSPSWLIPGIVGLAVLVIAGIVAAVLFLPANKSSDTTTGQQQTSLPSIPPDPTDEPAPPATTAPAAPAGTCVYSPNGQEASRPVPQPPAKPTFAGEIVRARVETNLGQMVFEMEAKNAPCTVNALRTMAEAKYFDNTACHRLVTTGIFVLQCGDPTGQGSGSPGFYYAEENLPVNKQIAYPKGSIAMAKTSAPNTTGSQFFINFEESPLPPEYTYVGSVIRGLDLVERVAKGGDDGSFGEVGGGKPKITLTIKSVVFY